MEGLFSSNQEVAWELKALPTILLSQTLVTTGKSSLASHSKEPCWYAMRHSRGNWVITQDFTCEVKDFKFGACFWTRRGPSLNSGQMSLYTVYLKWTVTLISHIFILVLYCSSTACFQVQNKLYSIYLIAAPFPIKAAFFWLVVARKQKMSIAARFKAQAIYVPYTMEVIHSYTAIEKRFIFG